MQFKKVMKTEQILTPKRCEALNSSFQLQVQWIFLYFYCNNPTGSQDMMFPNEHK